MDQAQAVPELSVHERIMAAIGGEEEKQPLPESQSQEPQSLEAPEEGQAQAQPEPEGEKATIEIDPDEKLFDVEVAVEGGEKKTEKLSLNELKAQRMMQADYQRKTQEVARQREEVGEKIRQGIQAQQTEYLQRLQAFQDVLTKTAAPELANVNWDKLATEDPAEYIRASNRARQVEQAWQAIEAEKGKALAQLKDNHEAQLRKLQTEAQERVKQHIPHWNDDLKGQLKKTAIDTYGFKGEEVDQIFHPGFMRLLHDAHEFQKTKSAKPADKKVVVTPKVVKPGVVQTDGNKNERVKETMSKLRKSGSVNDAAAAIFHMIK
jgi:hypothetical protein